MIARLWSGLRARLVLTYLIIFLVSAAILAGRAGILYSSLALEGQEHDMETQAYLMASAVERPWMFAEGPDGYLPPAAQLQNLAGRFAQGTEAQFTILDGRGVPIATTFQAVPANQTEQPEVAGALHGRLQHDVRYDPFFGQTLIFAAAPIEHEGRVLGVVQVAMPETQLMARTQRFWLDLAVTGLLAALAAALAGWLLATRLVHPVALLRDAATRLAGGDLDTRVRRDGANGVAEINQLADAFNHMAGRIQDMLNRERAFVANASHELRTPLTNIKLRAEALGNGALNDPGVAQRFVREIEGEADRLTRMANDLLTLSRHDAGAEAFREPIDAAVLVNDVIAQMSMRAERSHINLFADVAPDLPRVTGDPVGLHTVLGNLVDNALQHTGSSGQVAVRACLDPEAEARMILAVSDTGTGIPPEDLPHIFDRFYRADKARSRRSGQNGAGNLGGSGAGLGLAIVRSIVEDHGGEVRAESQLGHGTTVTVTLPVGG